MVSITAESSMGLGNEVVLVKGATVILYENSFSFHQSTVAMLLVFCPPKKKKKL